MLIGKVLNDTQVILFGLIWLRMVTFVFSSAVLGSPTINPPIKVLFSVVMAFIVFPFAHPAATDSQSLSDYLILLAGREALVGLILGLMTRFFFFALSMAGELISLSVGLGSAQIYNPFIGQSGQVIEQFFSLTGTVVFLALNGHHLFITAMVQSFDVIPFANLSLQVGGLAEVAQKFQEIFIIMIKMASPVIATVFVVNLSMAIMGRAVPQLNVLVTSFPVTILIGLTVLIVALPLMTIEMNFLMEHTSEQLFKLMRSL
jgi:flagellar biosynthetic protein FliR